jgi:hypothetical protein
MKTKVQHISPDINPLIFELRGQRVILASDLAAIYGVTTKVLNQAVRRNAQKFPADFVFQLTDAEAKTAKSLRSQIVTLKRGEHQKYLPNAFTEHGALMAANCLNSGRAVEMSVYVVRAFVKMRSELAGHLGLAKRLAEIEKMLVGHDSALRDLYNKIRPLLLPQQHVRREIGFHAKPESKTAIELMVVKSARRKRLERLNARIHGKFKDFMTQGGLTKLREEEKSK